MRTLTTLLLATSFLATAPFLPAQEEGGVEAIGEQDRVTLNLKDQDLGDVLEMFSTTYGLNLVYGPEVAGSVTMNLFEVPAREALAQVLFVNGYELDEKDGLLRVVPISAGEGEQAPVVLAGSPFEPRVVYLDHVRADDVVPMLTPLLASNEKIISGPGSGTGLTSTDDTGGNNQATREMFLLLAGDESWERVQSLLSQVDVPPQQVLVEATILSVRLSDNHKLGVDFTALGGIDFQAMGGKSTVFDGVSTDEISGGQLNSWSVGADTEGFTTPGSDGLHLGILRNQIGVFIEALESVGQSTVLSNPSVLTVNRHAAQVLIGRRIGYLTSTTTETSTQQTVQFLEVGTSLVFRPFISGDGYVRMEIKPENSDGEINPVTGLPDESTTEVTTNILVRSGHTVVIGGLMETTTTTDTSQVPFLGSLPFVGTFFRGESQSESRNEIIVLLTPHIVGQDELDARAAESQQRFDAAKASLAASHQGYLRPSYARRMYAEAGLALARGDAETALAKAEWGLSAMPADPDLAQLAAHCRTELEAQRHAEMELQDAVQLLDESKKPETK
jgi:type IV pilus assembly protein PilQ